jgi:Carbohydrate-selective porin, OprB family
MKKLRLYAGTVSLMALLGAVSPAFAGPNDTQQINKYLQQGLGDSVSQVNSVSELTDVDPNSWAFQALKSIVERFGCLEGYPNKTYLGNKPTSRYEFAAGLNACLEKVNDLITSNTANKATKEDLATLKRLQDEFASELAALRGRVDALEAKTKDIESKLFNVNSKLDASVVMAITGGGASSDRTLLFAPATSGAYGDSQVAQFFANGAPGPGAGTNFTGFVSAAGGSANTSFAARTSLNIRATFSGQDELLIRLRGVTGQAVDAVFPGIASNNGTLFYAGGAAGSFDQSTGTVATNGSALVSFDKLRYSTSLFSDKLRVFFGPRIDLFEYIDTNSFANNAEVDFSNGGFINNRLLTPSFLGAGGGFDYQFNDFLALRAVYVAANGGATSGNPNVNANPQRVPYGAFGAGGLFGGSNTVAVELEVNPIKTASIKLQYSHFVEQGQLLGTTLPNGTDSGTTDVFGVNAEWAITPGIALFGRYGTAYTNLNRTPTSALAGLSFNQITSSTWQAGLTLPNLLGSGNAFGFAYGQPIRVNSGQIGGFGFTPSGTEQNIEAFFRFQVSDRLSITPDFQYIIQPVNINNNAGISIGTVRAVFTF